MAALMLVSSAPFAAPPNNQRRAYFTTCHWIPSLGCSSTFRQISPRSAGAILTVCPRIDEHCELRQDERGKTPPRPPMTSRKKTQLPTPETRLWLCFLPL